MTDPRVLALLHAELDGDLDAAGRAELASHLAADPALSSLRAELAAVDAGLAALHAVEPPAVVLADILAGLPPVRRESVVVPLRATAAAATVPATRSATGPETSRATVMRSRRMVRVWAYAASLLAVVGTGALLQQSGLLTAELADEAAGTLVQPGAPAELLDSVPLEFPGVSGRAQAFRDEGVRLEIELANAEDLRVVVLGGGTEQALAAPRQPNGARQQLQLKLPAAAIAAGRVNLRLEAQGRVVGEASLAVQPSGLSQPEEKTTSSTN
jgi:hypothetical protein